MNTSTMVCCWLAAVGFLPTEPVEVGHTPQFFVDDHIVDNRWALKQKTEEVLRVFHPPRKYEGNPLIAGDGGYVSVVREPQTGLFRMWYQTHDRSDKADDESSAYAVAYAESKDGLVWTRPELGLIQWKGSKANNIVWRGPNNNRASGPQILELPDTARRGFRYVMVYRTSGAQRDQNGIRLVGSHDGLRWETTSDTLLSLLPSDTLNSIVFDATRQLYVMFCRAKHIYRAVPGTILQTGESRRIARMCSPELWTHWRSNPQNILIPDELDMARGFNRFYGMPAKWHAGIYWGFLWCFRLNSDIWTELAWSRDGVNFERFPTRPALLNPGPTETWDGGMVFASPWVEVGDEWWFYYAGWNGPHESRQRTAGIGLARLRKEGFISMRGPPSGGIICTRLLRWPGGKLLINADAHAGEVKVRVCDAQRRPLLGFDYADCVPFRGNNVRHEVQWRKQTIRSLKGQTIRLEFLLTNADLYTFTAATAD
ncbi:MAG: hypothetical protein N3B01_03660 [Verrucomicrobiae bacterium]|nr:hypothetical protein [Verrucomicrobiae bacterium]